MECQKCSIMNGWMWHSGKSGIWQTLFSFIFFLFWSITVVYIFIIRFVTFFFNVFYMQFCTKRFQIDNHEKLLAILFCLSISFLFHYQVFFLYLNFDCVEYYLAFCVSMYCKHYFRLCYDCYEAWEREQKIYHVMKNAIIRSKSWKK